MRTFIYLISIAVISAFSGVFLLPAAVFSHCQIPCGIYDDHARVMHMLEDTSTIEKSVKRITDLSGKTDAQSQHQLIRWVMNKEKHAQNIIETISNYFLTQRINPDLKDYQERLVKHHSVILNAMKVKQNTTMKHVKNLEKSIKALSVYYPEHTQ